ncbi:UvrD-helicase-domain-containing protein [Aspergillus steynii IBT 23096]|uniref:DNA 3'-5' helicase n=1 Tax=Aspergillus steynii IBT 23096 TaxID=1392250 RepID=A0A2I2FY44_9EURO|nr:UvrD-helicase-domain-containing protein [Aspergillus steynii IBT 23096]PLB45550.1 UvrD-helicase-domain-containing protein [Aspergillus steynii IBT 23096]
MDSNSNNPINLTSILDGLNFAQSNAVASPAPILQVLAPPGSGKTKTLTARVAYLLAYHGYRPQDVICCTFTIKASREMRERLGKLVGEQVQSRLILGTFHSICRRYLVRYGHLIGLRKGFGIADSSDSLAVLRRIVKRLQLSIQPNTARSRISHQKAHGVSPDEAAAKFGPNNKALEHREFVQVYQEYEDYLAASNLLDYDDLLLRCAELLRKNPDCVANVQAVLVDEFQDTNHIQYELMNLFACRNRRITVVGDPDQSIYGFRSAEIKNLDRMQKLYRDTSVVLLEDNYRSSGSILSSAQDVIEQDSSRPAKKLQPTHSVGTMPVLRKLPSAEAEAQWIVMEIRRGMAMSGKLLNYSDYAILLRSAALSRQIESEMGKQGIPYKMVGGLRFFDRVEIKLLLDYLRVISQPGNADALLRVINVPSRKIGEETIRTLLSSAEKAQKTLWDFIKDVAQGRRSTEKPLSKPSNQGLCTLVGLIESSRQKLQDYEDGSAPRKLLDYVIKKLSFRDFLTTTYGANEENRWANVEELLNQADDTAGSEQEEPPDDSLPEIQGLEQQQAHAGEEALSRFLANVALSTEVKPQEAKGLEWPVVFVPAVCNGVIPHSRAEDWDEERRLLYVAMTRAQALLYLSCPRQQARTDEETSVSTFLPDALVESRFRAVGPNLQEKIIYGIADILRRPRPSNEAMIQGQVSLPSVHDDRWTAEGEEAADAVFRWDGSRAVEGVEEPCAKRRRYDSEQWSTTLAATTMSTSAYTMGGSNYSAPPTTMSLGFSTARQYIATNPAATDQNSQPSSKSDSSKPKPKPPSAGGPGRQSDGLTQKSISRFFGQPSSSAPTQPRSSESTPTDRQMLSQGNSRRGVPGGAAHAASSNPGFKSVIPRQYSTYRPQPQRLQPTRPVLEPSDPNRYTWLGASSSLSQPAPEKPIMRGGQEKGGKEMSDQSEAKEGGWGASEVKRSEQESAPGVRPVTTYHTTTMSLVQGGSGLPPPRRTLGIRRSMNGWEERMKRAGNEQSR